MATFLRFFRPLKRNAIYLKNREKISHDINKSFYDTSATVQLTNNGVFQCGGVEKKDSEKSGSLKKASYLLGFAASFFNFFI